MDKWLRVASGIDRFSEWTGRVVYWLTLVMVLAGSYNAIVRFLDRYTGLGLSSNTYIELQWYLFSIVFLAGSAYTLKHDAHVRVDVLYGRLSPRGKAWIDLLGTILFLFPFCLLMIGITWFSVKDSWSRLEMSPDPGGLPRYPIKTLIPVAFVFLLIQGVAICIKQIMYLRGKELANIARGADAANPEERL